VASDRGVEENPGGRIVARWVLIETLMRPVVVEMIHIPVEDSAGVSPVVDQQSIGAFVADAANELAGLPTGGQQSRPRARGVRHSKIPS
jgi:hypothetical protein